MFERFGEGNIWSDPGEHPSRSEARGELGPRLTLHRHAQIDLDRQET